MTLTAIWMLVVSSSGLSAATVPGEGVFAQRWKELRQGIERAQGRQARLDAFRAARKGIQSQIPDAEKRLAGGDRGARPLVQSLHALDLYLGKIPDAKFEAVRCEDYREEIVASFSPKETEPAWVPGEAREALEILKRLCAE